MPVYFSENAPVCPVSRDQPVGLETAPTIRTTIPFAFDLASAIAAANAARAIMLQILAGYTFNNVIGAPPPLQPQTLNLQRPSRWTELTDKRVVQLYKYFGIDAAGQVDPDVWVIIQRIQFAVWYDSAWKTYLVWDYRTTDGTPV